MNHHRSDARKVLEAMAYAVKRYDDNGIDMRCTQGDRKVSSTERTKRLVNVFDELDFMGIIDMEISLDRILQDYKDQFPGPRSSSALFRKIMSTLRGPPKPLSLYILTDGNWQQGCNVEAVIRSMVEFLVSRDLRKQVAIQFIRFGDTNQQAIDSLNYLDDGLDLKLYEIPIDRLPSSFIVNYPLLTSL